VVILIAALGFAAVSADSQPATDDTTATLPDSLSARVVAAGFAAVLNPEVEVTESAVAQTAASPRVAPVTTAAPPATTTTTAAPTTTTAAPTTTTTTTAAPTTTTAPTTTAAPTTTTAAPTTTTTAESTTTTTAPPADGGTRDVEEWRYLVEQFFSTDLVEGALSVMRCESRGDPLAYNSVSGASGLYQFIPSTWAWASENAGFGGASPFDPSANIGSAAHLVQRSIDQGKDAWAHWSCKP
jgi:hypothetical protein